jgi:hypothetical protein
MQKDDFKKELGEFLAIRDELFAFFDRSLPKDKNKIIFDFSSKPTLEAKEFYNIFYKYDYQARKALANAANLINGAH